MPAKSQSQQRLMAMCLHRPDKVKGDCPDMSKEELRKFAETKRKGLPKKVGLGSLRKK